MPGFADLIASHLGIPQEQAASLLLDFVQSLREEVESSGEAVIPGIGVFSHADAGLAFVPHPSFAATVNFQYAGLEPVEVAINDSTALTSGEGIDDAEPPVEEDAGTELPPTDLASADREPEPTEPDYSSDPPVVRQESETEAEEEVAAESDEFAEPELRLAGTSTADIYDEPEEVFEEPEDGAHGRTLEPSVEEEPPPEQESAGPETDLEAVEPSAHSEAGHGPVPAGIASPGTDREAADRLASTQTPRRSESLTRRSATPWLLAGVFLIILAGVGLFLFLADRPATEGGSTADGLPPAAVDGTEEEPDVAASEDLSQAETAEDDATAATGPEDVGQRESLPDVRSMIYGNSIDRSERQYTLVVTSLPSDAAAQETAENWRDQGFRTGVFSETIDDVTRYRVGIGQFPTIEIADSIRSESDVATDLPEGTWVYRYPAATPQ